MVDDVMKAHGETPESSTASMTLKHHTITTPHKHQAKHKC